MKRMSLAVIRKEVKTMRKSLRVICMILLIAMFVGLASGCTNKTEVKITVDNSPVGTELASIPVTVTVNGKDTPCRVEWQMLNETSDAYETASGVMENGKDYLAYVYYNAGATLGDENLNISVAGAELNHSEMVGEEILTVVRINLLEKGNLTIVCGNVIPCGSIGGTYCAVKLDGEKLPINYQWSVTYPAEPEATDEDNVFSYGKIYQLSIDFFPEEDFVLEKWPVRVNCGLGELTALEKTAAGYHAEITFDFGTHEENVSATSNLEIIVGSDQIGSPLSSIPVNVSLGGEKLTCRTEWSVMNDPAYGYVPTSGTLENGKDYIIYIYYVADITIEELVADSISVTGAELDHSEMAGEEILTVVRVNLLEKGNLTLTVGSHNIGMPIEHAYCVVKLDGEKLYSEYKWSILKGSTEEVVEENGNFEEGNCYQITIRFIPTDDFDPDDYAVRLNCEGGELLSMEADGAEYVAKIKFNYANDHVCTFVLNEEKPATNSCENSGEIFYLCLECGKEKVESVPAFGHNPDWSNASYISPKTCVQSGEEKAACRVCGKIFARTTDTVGEHDWKETDREDYCDQGMMVYYTCSVCGTTKSEKTESSHRWNESGREDLCDQGVTVYYTCGKCGASKNEVVAGSHNWVRIDHAGSCPYGIQLVLSCTKCGEIDTSQWIYPGEHSYSGAEYWNNHTHVFYCTECGEEAMENHITNNKGYCATCDHWIVN